MPDDPTHWDYLFVSDLHLSLGYDCERRTYHAREDFFFDEAFFRWLRWADGIAAEGRRWELVFVGDVLDFLPVDGEMVAQYYEERDRREQELDPTDPWWATRYWQGQFGGAPPEERAPERVQRLLFEDDVLNEQVVLEPRSAEAEVEVRWHATAVPEWAQRLYARHRPEVMGEAETMGVPLVLQAPLEGEKVPAPVDGEDDPTPTPNEHLRQERARRAEAAFEQRYGFLPTPEKSADKLESIYSGHPLFFRALAWFIGRGHRVVFLRGNHDLELFWPRVQERLREFVIREYPAAFGYDEGSPAPPNLRDRIDFHPGWFYYRRGLFYAEHGCQYEPLDACPNPIRPLMPGDDQLLNPPVGSLGVICFNNHLEDPFPEWENRGDFAIVLLDLIRRYPFKTLAMVIRHGLDFLRMAQRLWLAGKEKRQEPGGGEFARYAESVDLKPETVRKIYREGDTPLLLRQTLTWVLFSPPGHAAKVLLLLAVAALAIGGGGLWYLVVAPALASLLPANILFATVGPALQLLTKILLWLAPPAVYAIIRRRFEQQYSALFLSRAASRIDGHLREQDPALRHFVFGHDHRADVRPMGRRDDGSRVYYLNTGSWTPWFAEGERRLQTLGQEVQFTFARLMKGEHGYKAELLRWNDEAGRADPQMVPRA